MPKVNKNIVIQGISGAFGEVVFRQMPNGETWASRNYDFSRRKFSGEQKRHQKRFQEAAAYAREAAKSNPIYAELAKDQVKTAYNIALSDWFKPPVIHGINRQDGTIQVRATDNVQVAQVRVMILNEQNEIVEQGEAVQVDSSLWQYACTAQGTIRAEAWDWAGNTAIKTSDVLKTSEV